ncbi:MAG: TolC family outer membrane protein [Gammaproteobacteria bacterium]
MNKISINFLFTASLSFCAFSIPLVSQAENLMDVYSLAVSSDPTLQSAYASRMATREAFPAALAGFLPALAGNGQYNVSDSDYKAQFGSFGIIPLPQQTIDRNMQVNATVSQTIFDLSRWHNLKQAKQTVSYADAAYMASEQDLIIRTASAYFNLLAAQDNLEFIQAEKKAVGRQLDQTQQKFNVGLVAVTDVKDLTAQFDAKLAEEISAQNTVENNRQQLKILTGQFIEHIDGLKQLPLDSPEPFNDDEWVSMAEQYNPTLQAAKYQSDALRSAVSVAKDQYLPTLEYNAGYGQIRGGSPGTPIGDWEKQWNSSVIGSINIFSGGAIASNVRKAQYEHQASMQDFEQVKRNTETNTRNAFRNVIASIGQVNAFARAVESANASLESTTAGYDVGTRTSVDLLAVISNLYQQESNLATARYNYILAILQLKQAAGTLNSEDVFQVNGWLASGESQAQKIIESLPGASGTQADKNIQKYQELPK